MNGLTSHDIADLLKLKSRREKRRKAVDAFAVALLSTIGAAFVDGWFLMLAVGVAHAHWLPKLPTVGYWTAVVLVALLRGVFREIKPRKKDGAA